MAKLDYTKALKDYGTVVTFGTHFFTDKKTGNSMVQLTIGKDTDWYSVETGTLLKSFLGTTTTVILDGKTVVYPNCDTHPVPAKVELPAELKAISERIRAHKVEVAKAETPAKPVEVLAKL